MATNDDEQLANLVFATMLPAARLTADRGLPLRRLKQLAELATFGVLKRRRLSLKDIAERITVSLPKVSQLSRQLKDHFSRPDAEYGVSRRILMLLRAGPETESRIAQALSDLEPEVVSGTLAQLLEDGLVETVPGRTVRYRICKETYRQVRQAWVARVDALTNLMASVADVIKARFFESDDRAFARTVSFNADEDGLERLRELYETQVFPLVLELDRQSEESGEGAPVSLSLFWAPESES